MKRGHRLGLSVGALLGVWVGLLVPTAGCIFPDHCILVKFVGNDYCSVLNGALMWPIGEPELAEPVKGKSGAPVGCRCLNATEAQQLTDKVPEAEYLALLEDIHDRGRNTCASNVPQGFDHNCYTDQIEFSDITIDDGPNRSATCIDSCTYTNPPSSGNCPDDPDPFECNDDGGGDDVGGIETNNGGVGETGFSEVRI